MAFFWFIIVVILLIILSRRKAPAPDEDRYAQGYWDGFRAAGERVGRALSYTELRRDELQAIVDEGRGDVPAPVDADVPLNVDEHQDAFDRSLGIKSPSTAYVETAARDVTPAERSLQNLNTMLYMASFLLVAAAAAFIATSMPADVRLVGLITVVVLFYGGGMVLHRSVARLRPAAIAFIGTGLAILPFVGVALHMLGGMPEAVSWLVISIIGLIAYAVAAVVLQSQVVSYLTMAFVLSLVSAAVATASLSLIWYFIALIGVSLLANMVSFMWPQRVPGLFRLPIEQTGQVVTPLAVVASLLVSSQLTIRMYELLFGVVSAHYLVVWLQQRQYWQVAVVRGLLHVTAAIVVWDFTGGATEWFNVWWLALATMQGVGSLVAVRPDNASVRLREHVWLICAAGAIIFTIPSWLTSGHPAAGVAASLTLIGFLATAVLLRLREIGWAYVGLGVSIILPFVIGRWLIVPPVPWTIMIGGFTVLSAGALCAYYWVLGRRSVVVAQLLSTATLVHAALVVTSGVLAQDTLVAGWSLVLAAAILIVMSYVAREYILEFVGAVLAVIAIFLWVYQSGIAGDWQLTAAICLSVGLLMAAVIVHHLRGETARRTPLIALGMVVFAGLVGNMTYAQQPAAATSLALLLIASIGSLLLRVAVRQASVQRVMFMGGYPAYLVLAWITSWLLPAGWQVLVYTIAVVVIWASSYVERLPYLSIAGNLVLVVLLAKLWSWLQLDPVWMAFGVAWLAAGLLYGVYWLMVERGDRVRQWICLGSVLAVLGLVALFQFAHFLPYMRIAAAGSIIAAGAVLGIHGYLLRKRGIIEGSIYAMTFGVQRIVGIQIPEVDIVFYAHWWALTIALIAYWRGAGQRIERLIVAMAMVSVAVGSQALSVGGGYQLLFLVEHLALLVAGVQYRRQWAMWWGVTASVLAILYFLKDYLFLWLAFLGLVLIAIAIWRLTRSAAGQSK